MAFRFSLTCSKAISEDFPFFVGRKKCELKKRQIHRQVFAAAPNHSFLLNPHLYISTLIYDFLFARSDKEAPPPEGNESGISAYMLSVQQSRTA